MFTNSTISPKENSPIKQIPSKDGAIAYSGVPQRLSSPNWEGKRINSRITAGND